MIVGFTITDFKGHEKEAEEYIRKVCILESPDIATNIVKAGAGVNIFSNALTTEDLLSQPFESKPIEIKDGKHLLVSIVNFNLELLYNGRPLRLLPTEFIYVDPSEVSQFEEYIKQGLIKVIPEVIEDGKSWILADGTWNDDGIWVDSDFWRDSND